MQNVSDIVRFAADRWPEDEAVVFRHRRHTYRQFAQLVGGRVQQLRELGARAGDAVVTLAGNSDVLLIEYLALAALGALNVPLNTMSTAAEAIDAIRRTAPVAVVYGSDYEHVVEEVRTRATASMQWLPLDAECEGSLGHRPRAQLEASPVGGDEPAMVIFTSGSTGRPKGCVKSHVNLIWHVINQQLGMPRDPSDREMYTIPLAGIGLANFALVNFMSGGTLVLERFEPSAVLQTLVHERITTVFLPPTMLHTLFAVPGQAHADLGCLTRVYSGYEMSERLRHRIAERFGPIVLYGYGSSEGTISYAPADRFLSDPQCVGHVFGMDELKIVDPEGAAVVPGGVGEIVGRGPSIFLQYLGDPELTALTLRDCWYHTGDLGWMGPGSDLHFAGRLKDMIKSGGMNVAAAEVEQALGSHPQVDAVAVIGVPDEKWGESVVAAVVTVVGADVDADGLRAYVRGRLAGYKCPKHVVFFDRLPVNPTGKVAKGVLRDAVLHRLAELS